MKKAVKDNFDYSANAYREYEAGTQHFELLAKRLAEKLDSTFPNQFELLIDAGAGTGASTKPLREIAAEIIALDFSRPMLIQNDSKHRLQADFGLLPMQANTVDCISFTASLFLTPSPIEAVREAKQVLSPDGTVAAVAPQGWYIDGTDVFNQVGKESKSPSSTKDVKEALEECFQVQTGLWEFDITADQLRQFYQIPAVAARLYPRCDPSERIKYTQELLSDVQGEGKQVWRWMIGTHP